MTDVLVSSFQFAGANGGRRPPDRGAQPELREDRVRVRAPTGDEIDSRHRDLGNASRRHGTWKHRGRGRPLPRPPHLPAPPPTWPRSARRSTRPASPARRCGRRSAPGPSSSPSRSTSPSTTGGSARSRRRSRRSSGCSCSTCRSRRRRVDRALGGSGELLVRLGVAVEDGELLRAAARIVPHDDLLIASDRVSRAAPEHVAGVHWPSATLSNLTVRREVATRARRRHRERDPGAASRPGTRRASSPPT